MSKHRRTHERMLQPHKDFFSLGQKLKGAQLLAIFASFKEI
jgi:hypothetical protein